MSKHREALEALKTIANYCNGRDCHTECIFFNGKDRGSVCRLVCYKFSPAYLLILTLTKLNLSKNAVKKLER